MYEDDSLADEKMDSPDSDADRISMESEGPSDRQNLSDINFVVSDAESVFVNESQGQVEMEIKSSVNFSPNVTNVKRDAVTTIVLK